MEFRVERLVASQAAVSFADLADIYTEAFPANERVPVAVLQAGLQDGTRTLWRLSGAASNLAFAVCVALDRNAWLLEYLATDAACRSQGLGANLLQRVRRDLAESGGTTLYLEGEPPISDSRERWRERRLKWYLRQGAAIVIDENSYAMPEVGTGGLLPMKLLAAPLGQDATPAGEQLCGDVRSIFLHAYGLQADSPHVTAVLRGLEC